MDNFRLLLCDDEELAMQWVRLALAEVGGAIEFDGSSDWLGSVKETRDLIESGRFNYDVVVTDMIFEGEDELGGFTILEEIKRHFPYTEVIVLTGYSERISVDELFKVEDIYRLSSGTWIKKEGTPEEIGLRLATAVRRVLPEVEQYRARRWREGRPYQLRLNEASHSFTVFVPSHKLSFEVTGLQPRHWRILRLLAESETALGEQRLIDLLHLSTVQQADPIARYFPREQLVRIGAAIGSPTHLCELNLSHDGRACDNYDRCFPSLSKAEAGKTARSVKPAMASWKCPLHMHITDYLPGDGRRKPKRLAVDINFIRNRIINSVGGAYEPLSRRGEANDLLRRTDAGYRLAATILP